MYDNQAISTNLVTLPVTETFTGGNEQCCQAPAQEGSYIGRSWQSLKEGGQLVWLKIYAVSRRTLVTVTLIGKDANVLASIGRKLDQQVIRPLDYMFKASGKLFKWQSSVSHTVGFVDSIQVLTDADYFVNKKYLNDRITVVTSKVFFTMADVGGALLWLEEMKFFNLKDLMISVANVRVFSFVPKSLEVVSSVIGHSFNHLAKAAVYIGEIRIFSWTNAISVKFIACRTLTLAYVFCAIDAVYRLSVAANRTEKTQAGLDLAAYLGELSIDAVITLGVTNMAVVGGVGAIAICLVIASFAYKAANQQKPQASVKVSEPEKVPMLEKAAEHDVNVLVQETIPG